MSSASLIREALNKRPCPLCHKRTLLTGWFRPTRVRCMSCGHRGRYTATIVKRRGEVSVAFGPRPKADHWYGGHRAW